MCRKFWVFSILKLYPEERGESREPYGKCCPSSLNNKKWTYCGKTKTPPGSTRKSGLSPPNTTRYLLPGVWNKDKNMWEHSRDIFTLFIRSFFCSEKTQPLRYPITNFSLTNVSPSAFQAEAAEIRGEKEQWSCHELPHASCHLSGSQHEYGELKLLHLLPQHPKRGPRCFKSSKITPQLLRRRGTKSRLSVRDEVGWDIRQHLLLNPSKPHHYNF